MKSLHGGSSMEKRYNIDAVTVETLSGGERTVNVISIDKSILTKNCKLGLKLL